MRGALKQSQTLDPHQAGLLQPTESPDLRAGNALARGHRGGALGPAGSASARGDALVVLTRSRRLLQTR